MALEDDQLEEEERGLMRHVWHGVATLLAAFLMYASVMLQRDVDWVVWFVLALVAEPGTFWKLAKAHGGKVVDKWLPTQKS